MNQSGRSPAADRPRTAAASLAISALLDGPARRAEQIGSFPVAVYLRTAGGVVALVGPGGVRLPNAMALSHADLAVVARHAPTGPLQVGSGGVQAGPVRVIAGRWWDPVPRLGEIDVSLLARRLDAARAVLPPWPDGDDPAGARLSAGRATLATALGVDGSAAGAVAVVAHRLVGLGLGLTPAGDDLLAGAVAGLIVFGTALGRPDAVAVAGRLAGAVHLLGESTTVLAADLARHAARGALADPAAAFCRALADPEDTVVITKVAAAADRLLAVGHTSGRDLAEGLLLGASAAALNAGG